MRESAAVRDPWVGGGLALLALLTVGTVLLYRGEPQSVAEARTGAMVAVRPSAFAPRIARAQELARAADAAALSGDTVGAMREYAAAAEQAWAARGFAEAPTETSAATEAWADAVLDRSALMLASASAPWWRRDDDAALQDALAQVERVVAVPTSPAARQRARALAEAIRAKLRPGPLEWLPRR
jgi:hypothetical protein